MNNAIQSVFSIIILIFSVVVHEVAHGFAALALGDKTAQLAGRLTLNPFKHLDPFGSVVFPLLLYVASGGSFVFGWAKPVPFNPYNLRNKKWGPALVALAGPLANVLVATFFALWVRFLPGLLSTSLRVFVLNFLTVAALIAFVNLILAFFNLVPIPPLDGSKILFAFLPVSWRGVENFLERFGYFLLLAFIIFFSHWILPPVFLFFRLVAGSFPLL